MNILFFCQLYPPAIFGGGEYIFFQWAKELAKRGHRVISIAQKLDGTADFEVIDKINVFRIGSSTNYSGGLPISVGRNFDYLSKSTLRGLSIASQNGVDIIHSNTYIPGLSGYVCAKVLRKPFVITFHDIYFLKRDSFWHKWGSQGQSTGLISLGGPLIEKLLLKLPNVNYQTVSDTSKKDLLLAGVKDVTVIPNGLDMGEYSGHYKKDYDPLQCIFIGRLVFYKNLETVIKAFKRVVKAVPLAKLVIVGDGPMMTSWIGLVVELGLSKNVIFVGRVTHEEKVRLIMNSAFLVNPSVVEGFGIVVLEAFACRKPTLVSAVLPLTEIVEDGKEGCIVPPFDSEAWAQKMIMLFKNPEKASDMGVRGREKLEFSYTIPKIVDKLETFYSNILAR
jgi:glycosyltransferase involved in cell wall biosynthesis